MATNTILYVINPNQTIKNGATYIQPLANQVGASNPTMSGVMLTQTGFADPLRVQELVSSDQAVQPSWSSQFVQMDQERRERHGTASNYQFSVANTPVQLLGMNGGRLQALITNNGPNTIYLGHASGTAVNGTPLYANGSYHDDVGTDAWWAVAPTGSGDIRVEEYA